MHIIFCILLMLPHLASAQALTTTRIIKAGAILNAADITQAEKTYAGAVEDAEAIIGKEARVALYPGRPIMANSFGAPRIITRNQVVRINYINSNLAISAEGRALNDGGIGDTIQIMNIASRNMVFGMIMQDGSVQTAPQQR